MSRVDHEEGWQTYAQLDRKRAAMNHSGGHQQWTEKWDAINTGVNTRSQTPATYSVCTAKVWPKRLPSASDVSRAQSNAYKKYYAGSRRHAGKRDVPHPRQNKSVEQLLLTDALAAIQTRQAGKTEPKQTLGGPRTTTSGTHTHLYSRDRGTRVGPQEISAGDV